MSENSTDNLTEKERNIVSLINSLAEAADDETTTQEAIDRIVGQIKSTTSESIKDNLEKAEKERQSVQFPSSTISTKSSDLLAPSRMTSASFPVHIKRYSLLPKRTLIDASLQSPSNAFSRTRFPRRS